MRPLADILVALTAHSAVAQAPVSPSAPPTAPLAVPAPNYVTQRLEIVVSRPAAETWARIGRFCDMREWLPRPCAISSGQDGELGAIRALPGGTVELIVAVTPLSYTYAFPVRIGVPYTMQHNTLEVRAVDARTSRIVYSFVWDNSATPPARRAAEFAARENRLRPALARMKALVENATPRP